MRFPSGLIRRPLAAAYRRFPEPIRTRALTLVHGETPAQQKMLTRVREFASKVHVAGHGDQVVGGVLRPYKAVTVTNYDAWKHLSEMRDAVVTALVDASMDVFEVPNQTTPLLVINSADCPRAWSVLCSTASMRTFWARSPDGSMRCFGDYSSPDPSTWLNIFQRLRAPNGELVADERIFLRLEGWAQVAAETVPRVDGGFHAAGTLVASRSNSFASYLAPNVKDRIRAEPRVPVAWLPSIDAVTQPVDLVYTWVDGSDPEWLAKKAEYEASGTPTTDAQVISRFENRDELRYSLRSVEMFANWYNHIYLVTDNQIPRWLDVSHPRLTVVDHRDLFTDSELPLFNSHAIESRLHKVNGLSEQFIYMNDDVFFGRPVRPELFFSGAGHPKFFLSKALIDPDMRANSDVSVTAAAKNNRELLNKALGRTIANKLKHTPHAHSKRLLEEMENRFPTLFENNVSARFRTVNDYSILSSLAQHYGAATGKALRGAIRYNYTDVSRPEVHRIFQRWLSVREFDAFCLNDTGLHPSGQARAQTEVPRFLERYFPLSSSLEVQGDG